jgi:hypothetical protein
MGNNLSKKQVQDNLDQETQAALDAMFGRKSKLAGSSGSGASISLAIMTSSSRDHDMLALHAQTHNLFKLIAREACGFSEGSWKKTLHWPSKNSDFGGFALSANVSLSIAAVKLLAALDSRMKSAVAGEMVPVCFKFRHSDAKRLVDEITNFYMLLGVNMDQVLSDRKSSKIQAELQTMHTETSRERVICVVYDTTSRSITAADLGHGVAVGASFNHLKFEVATQRKRAKVNALSISSVQLADLGSLKLIIVAKSTLTSRTLVVPARGVVFTTFPIGGSPLEGNELTGPSCRSSIVTAKTGRGLYV